MLSWGTVLLLAAVAVFLFILRVSGYIGDSSNLGSVFVFTILCAALIAIILASREGLRYAERQMVFVLDDTGIARKRQGYPQVYIGFSEIDTLSEEMRWLIITSAEPRRKIAVPNNVRGYEAIRAELAKHHALSTPSKFPLQRATKSIALTATSFLSWAGVLWLRDPRASVVAGVVGLTLLGFGSYRLWNLLRSRKRLLALVCLGSVWLAAILLIYIRAVRR
jgi:hypothetical protein